MMRKGFVAVGVAAIMSVIILYGYLGNIQKNKTDAVEENYKEISGTIQKGETLFDIFKRYKLDLTELFKIKEASASIHRLSNLHPGRHYKIVVNEDNQINSFVYWMDEDSFLNATRAESGFEAEKKELEYDRRYEHIGGVIKDNLISSIGQGRENIMLALQLSDIFSWDIDFTSDIRNGDTFKIVVEAFYLEGAFKKYGDILAAEFTNNGETYRAYRFEHNGKADFYDAEGKSLRKAFLKAPLNYRRISSGFSPRRFHPILKIYRPSNGVDFAAPLGTPVSAVGDGLVLFAGYRGQFGNLVIIEHPNGWQTYYAHLSKFGRGVRKGARVAQGQIIGYVGATGLATGPHLHYEIRINNRPVNPLTVEMPKGEPIPKELVAEFKDLKNQMDKRLASIKPYLAHAHIER
jgi:murein DD-endopeptidase MepM/ murein hydrolase activator NlpD